jgi:hypothetical protein
MELNLLQAILQHDANTNIGNLFYRSIIALANGAESLAVDINAPIDEETLDRPLAEEQEPSQVGSEAH